MRRSCFSAQRYDVKFDRILGTKKVAMKKIKLNSILEQTNKSHTHLISTNSTETYRMPLRYMHDDIEIHAINLFTIEGLKEFGVLSPFNPEITRVHFKLKPNASYRLITSIPRPGAAYNAWVITDASKIESSATDNIPLTDYRTIMTDSTGLLIVSFRSSLHLNDIISRKYFIRLEEVLMYKP